MIEEKLKKIADLMRSKDEAMRGLADELRSQLILKDQMALSLFVFGRGLFHSNTEVLCVRLYDCSKLIFPGHDRFLPWNNVAMWAHKNPDLKPLVSMIPLQIGKTYRVFASVRVSNSNRNNLTVKCFESVYKGRSKDYHDFEHMRLHKSILLNLIEV